MGTKRVGLARIEALMENLKREIALGGSTLVGMLSQTTAITGAGGSTVPVPAASPHPVSVSHSAHWQRSHLGAAGRRV